ncbi:MAG: GMP/IMP nucleotidase [Chromatiales bacterium]
MALDWNTIETVLLDMDGTLLDLHFDSHLWKQHLPLRYAERHGMDLESAVAELIPLLRAQEGTLNWYCLDYWTRELGLDIAALEREVQHLIAVRPHVFELLEFLRCRRQCLVLTTNAHRRSVDHKLTRTGIAKYFHTIVSAHDFGVPKEEQVFWARLQQLVAYHPQSTLLIDDNPVVLRAARDHGIAQLLAVALPDSRGPRRAYADFEVVESFLDLLPAAEAQLQP